MEEVWKNIPGYEGYYQVSSFGRVRSLDRIDSENHFRKGQILKFNYLRGYARVGLRNGKKQTMFQVHRLVALVFIPNPNNLPQVNHKDEDKLNNFVSNLEWCDSTYNINYGSRNQKVSNTHKGRKHEYSWVPVLCYSTQGEFVGRYENIKEAASVTKAQPNAITACCRNKKYYHTAGGYKWKYAT